MYEELMELIIKTDADIAECKHIIAFDDGTFKNTSADGSIIVFDREKALDLLFEDKLIRSYAWDKLYRKKVLNGIFFPKGKYYEDIHIMHDVFAKADKVAFLKKGLIYYRKREGSIMSSKDIDKLMDRLYSKEHRYTSKHAKGREKYAPRHFFYSVSLIKKALYSQSMSPELKRKYNKRINYYALKYCKGSALSLKDNTIKWAWIICPGLFNRWITRNS